MFLEMDVGHRLRNIREIKGFTRKEVERQTDGEFKESILAMYESGRRKISLPRLNKLAQFYHVSISFLIGEAPSPKQGVESSNIDAILMSDPDFSDEEKRILFYILGLLKAKKGFEGKT